MRIVVDVSPLALPRTGIGNYVRGMVAGLATALGPDQELNVLSVTGVAGRRRIAEALDELGPPPVGRRLLVLPYARGLRPLWASAGPAVERVVGRLEVFHLSDWNALPQRGGLRVRTIHDLVPLRFPDWVDASTRRLHERSYRDVRRCDLVVANSAFTARDVVERLGVAVERVAVAHPGISPSFGPDGPGPGRARPYVLTVASYEPRKNLAVLVEAVRLLRERGTELELVVAGQGWHPGDRAGGAPATFTGYVPDEELVRLYRGAAAVAYPSRFEGFGIPVVEGLASGVPVVASAHASLDEACGDAALRADPDSPDDWVAQLEAAVSQPDAERRRRGLAHAGRFTWQACGAAVLHGYLARLEPSRATGYPEETPKFPGSAGEL